jgi:hypothetical protein
VRAWLLFDEVIQHRPMADTMQYVCCLCVGTDMRLANYLLLALAAFQFPFSFLLAYRPV